MKLSAWTLAWLGLVAGPALAAETVPAKVPSFVVNGLKIAYADFPPAKGQGEPVVLLQGFAGNLNQWRPMRKVLLEAGYRVVAIDMRGHGQSDKPHNPRFYGAEMAEDVVRLLDHLKIRQAHLVGYSMGGDIANKVREQHPGRLLSVVMGGVGRGVTKGWTSSDFDSLKIAEGLERGEGLKPLFREPDGPGAKVLTEAEIERLNAQIMNGQDPLALAAVIRGYARVEVSEKSLRENAVPTLVIVGALDPEKPTVDELKRVMKNLRAVVLPGVDHFRAGVQPEFLRAAVEFLRAHPQQAPPRR